VLGFGGHKPLNELWIEANSRRMTDGANYQDPDLYDRIVQPGPCEAFYRRLANRCGGPVLDLACGTGRITVPLAKDGHEVVGVDLSPDMLGRADAKTTKAGLKIPFVQGDIRSFALGRRFGLVIVTCNSLAHLTRNEDLQLGLANIKRHLEIGGVLAFDVVNPRIHDLLAPAPLITPIDSEQSPNSVAIEQPLAYDPIQQTRTAVWRIDGEEGRGSRRLGPFRLRVLFPQELVLLLQASGFELVARWGDFEEGPFSPDSTNQVCLARSVA